MAGDFFVAQHIVVFSLCPKSAWANAPRTSFPNHANQNICLSLRASLWSRGGRTTKIHALTDRHCRLIAFLLTGGQLADCVAADDLLDQMPASNLVHGDKGYDSNAVRRKIEAKGAAPNIPPKSNRIWKNCFSPYPTETATPSSECLDASKIFAGSPPAMTASLKTSTPQSASLLSSATGYESRR